MKGLFRALAYLHDEKNIIHRDIKPDNIVLGSHKDLARVKLIDFGLAVQLTDLTEERETLCGTPNYISPEVILNQPYGL